MPAVANPSTNAVYLDGTLKQLIMALRPLREFSFSQFTRYDGMGVDLLIKKSWYSELLCGDTYFNSIKEVSAEEAIALGRKLDVYSVNFVDAEQMARQTLSHTSYYIAQQLGLRPSTMPISTPVLHKFRLNGAGLLLNAMREDRKDDGPVRNKGIYGLVLQPHDFWPETLQGLAECFWHLDIPLVTVYLKQQVGRTRGIEEVCRNCVPRQVESLLELCEYILAARFVIAPESDLSHLAILLGVPTIVIYPPSIPSTLYQYTSTNITYLGMEIPHGISPSYVFNQARDAYEYYDYLD